MQRQVLSRSCRLVSGRPLVLTRPSHSCSLQYHRARCQGNGSSTESTESFVITTPLYYVNAAPHMGSAYTTIAVDSAARFQRLAGKRVTMVTGTDEHGEKIAAAAAAKGLSPQEHCDRVADEFKQLWVKFGISENAWIRTTQPDHEQLVCSFLQRVKDSGDIYKDSYKGYYCVGCEKYLDDDEMDDKKRCKTHRSECSLRQEENYFFKLSKYQKQIEKLLAENPDFIQPDSRKNEVMGWVTSGLQDFSLSRAKVEWGIPVPWDPSQTFYVWTDALMGYMTAILRGAEFGEDSLSRAGWPANVHVVGKDIIRFHAVMWPALLLSAGFEPPKKVFGHGFLTKDGMKMGKALGNVLDPVALVDAYGADAVRFYFMREIRFGQDGDFGEKRFQDLVNAGLVNDVGNCLNRTLGLLHKYCNGQLPEAASAISADSVVRAKTAEAVPRAIEFYNAMDFSLALEATLSISGTANRRMAAVEPWSLLKKGTEDQKQQGRLLLVETLEAMRIVAILLSPVTPKLAQAMTLQLGLSEDAFQNLKLKDTEWGGLPHGWQTKKPMPVFARIEREFVTEIPDRKAPAIAG